MISKNSIVPFLKDCLIKFLTRPFLLDTNDKLYKKDEVINYLENNSFSYNKYKFEPKCHTDGFYY